MSARPASAPGAIPRILHQTWKTERVPEAWRPLQRGWRERHPGWEYHLWTDADLRRLVERHYAWLLPVFDGYAHAISRVDAARYLLLHRFGGVYVDLDFECLRPVDALLEGRELVLGLEPQAHAALPVVREHGLRRIVCNAFMASRPGHDFWEHVLRRLVAHRHERDPIRAAGPCFLTHALDAYPEPARITLAREEQIYPLSKIEVWDGQLDDPAVRERIARTAFAVHHWAGSWIAGYLAAEGRRPDPSAASFGPGAPPGLRG